MPIEPFVSRQSYQLQATFDKVMYVLPTSQAKQHLLVSLDQPDMFTRLLRIQQGQSKEWFARATFIV